MANGFVQMAPDSTGPKIQMFENVIGGNTVEAMAVTAISASGASNAFVQISPDATGKKIQYFENSIGGNIVEAIAVVLVDTSGNPI